MSESQESLAAPETLDGLYERMTACTACKMRAGCSRVVTAIGQTNRPALMIIGEAPGQEDDEEGIPFVGRVGEILRQALRETRVLDKSNTLITNVLGCRPPEGKFPKGDSAAICVGLWLFKAISIAKPERLLLLGNTPLKYVANMDKVTMCRGNWYTVRGIRTMVTFHPKFVIRQDEHGDTYTREMFEQDVQSVADEVKGIVAARGGSNGSNVPAFKV